MPEMTPESAEAVHKAKNAAHAVEVARQQQVENIADIVQERFEHVLAKGTEHEKSIILARVPYICQDIKGINKALQAISEKMDRVKEDLDTKDKLYEEKFVNGDQFWPVKTIVYGLVGLLLSGVVGALLMLVLRQGTQ